MRSATSDGPETSSHCLRSERRGSKATLPPASRERMVVEPFHQPAARLFLAALVGNVERGQLPAFAEQMQAHARSTQRAAIGRAAAERALELAAQERQHRLQDRLAHGGGLGALAL